MSPTDQNIAPWLLRSKVLPPRQLVAVLPRPRLLDLLDRGAQCALIWVQAPSGFGKSILLGEWRAHMQRKGAAVPWLTVDAHDDLETTLAHVAYALHVVGIDASATGLLRADFQMQRAPALYVRWLLALIERSPSRVVLCLDNLESLSAAIAEAVVDPLVHAGLENFTLVASSRRPAPFESRKLEDAGLLLDVGAADLAFNELETRRLLGESISRADASLVHRRTQGWPVLVRVIRSAIDMRTLAPGDLRSTDKHTELFAEILDERILAHLRGEVRAALIAAAIFEEMPFDAVDYVLGDGASALIKESVAELGPFMSPMEGSTDGFTLHPLLREHFLRTLKAANPQGYLRGHRSAAEWFRDRGDYVRAAAHAKQAAATDLLDSIFQLSGGIFLWMREGMARIRRMSAFIDDDVLRQLPHLMFVKVIVAIKDGRLTEAEQLLFAAEQRAAQLEMDPRWLDAEFRRRVIVEREISRALINGYQCRGFSRSNVVVLQDVAREYADGDPIIRGFIDTCSCLASLQTGDFETTGRSGESALHAFAEYGSAYAALFVWMHLAAALQAQGQLARADELLARATAAREAFRQDTEIHIAIDALAAEFAIERGNWNAAVVARLRGVERRLVNTDVWFDIYAAACGSFTEHLFLHGNVDAAMDFLNRFRATAAAKGVARVQNFSRALQLTILARAGRREQAVAILEAGSFLQFVGSPAAFDDLLWRETEVYLDALAAVGAPEVDARAFETVLLHLLSWSENRNLLRLRQKVLVHYALLLRTGGRDDEALAALRAALGIAAETGLRRPFVACDSNLATLIHRAREQTPHELSQRAAAVIERASVAAPKTLPPFGGMTGRQLEVVNALLDGQSDKAIARGLGISEHTVRYHLKHIFSKLGVSSRMEAISRLGAGRTRD